MRYMSITLERLKKTIGLRRDSRLSPDYEFLITALEVLYYPLFTQKAARNGKIMSVNLSLQAAKGIRFLIFLCL
jgi:hypothetical protein